LRGLSSHDPVTWSRHQCESRDVTSGASASPVSHGYRACHRQPPLARRPGGVGVDHRHSSVTWKDWKERLLIARYGVCRLTDDVD